MLAADRDAGRAADRAAVDVLLPSATPCPVCP